METLLKIKSGKVVSSLLIIFVLSFAGLFSSCTTTIRTPRHVRTGVVIQSPGVRIENNNRHDRSWRQERRERREHRMHND